MGICDANYKFTFVDIGAYGRRSDGGIFRDSAIGQRFYMNQMDLPLPDKLTVDGDYMPYVLVGDEAFQLTDFLLRPYSRRGGLNADRNIYNYRLSRARRVIENTFGILVSQWRFLKHPIEATVPNAMKMVQAAVCLHNWLRSKNVDENDYLPPDMVDRDGPNDLIPGRWRNDENEINESALQDIAMVGTHNSSRRAIEIRDEFCDYFNSEGAVPWQYKCE